MFVDQVWVEFLVVSVYTLYASKCPKYEFLTTTVNDPSVSSKGNI